MLCNKCLVDKENSCFPKDSSRKSGYKSSCKECYNRSRKSRAGDQVTSEYNKRYFQENFQELSSRYYTRNYKEAQLKRYHKNKTEIALKRKIYYQTQKYKVWNSNKEAIRRFKKSSATPKWLNQDQLSHIEYFYWLARDLELSSGQKYHVDHIVPLKHKQVCGLHVPWNLQILPAEINISKGNRYETL